MNKFAIIGDSTCDLTTEMRKTRNIDYCRMLVSWNDNGKTREIYASLDWDVLSPKQYFDLMREGKRFITSQVTEQEFDLVFLPHLEAGEDILYIACSSGLSASIHLAKRLVKEKYSLQFPDRKIVIIDSLNACSGQGLMLLRAADMRDAGASIEDIAKEIEETKLCYNQVAALETLSYLAKAGRVKAAKAFFGNLVGVKPILISDAKGVNYAVEKAKGRRNSLLRMVEMVKEKVIDPEKQICIVSHADAKQEDVDLVVNKIKETINFKDIVITSFGPIIGGTTGPGTFGVYFVGQKVTVVGE